MSNYNFSIKLVITKRPWMRDPNLEYLFCMSTGVLNSIFDKEEYRHDVKQLSLYFPERYMNIVEERSLYNRLNHFCPNLESLEIMTQSVYLIQCTKRENCMIVESVDEQVNGSPLEATTGRLWRDNVHGYDFSKLVVL